MRSSLGSLQVALTDQGEREAERLRVIAHAYDREQPPQSTGLRGLFRRLFQL